MSDDSRAPSIRRRITIWFFWSLFWFALVLGIGIIIDQSEAFTDCVHSRKDRKEYQALHERHGIIGGAIIRDWARLRLISVCAGDFADKNNGAIAGLATVVVAVFTFTLSGATRRLWTSAEHQLTEFRRSLDQSKVAEERQAADMKASIAVAREAMVAAERAYISVKTVSLIAVSNTAGNIIELNAIITFENTGNTPTKNMIYHSSMKIFDADIPEGFDFPDLDRRQPRRSFIAPKTWVGAFNFAISRAELDAAQAGRRRIFVWGWADYNDTFAGTPRRRTEFCSEIVIARGVPLTGNPRQWVGANQYGRHNAADDECDRRPRPYSAA
jgi:hypothetical protein